MIKVSIRSNGKNIVAIVSENSTPTQILTQAGIDFSRAIVSIDGFALSPAQMNAPLNTLTDKEECRISAIVKADNAKE